MRSLVALPRATSASLPFGVLPTVTNQSGDCKPGAENNRRGLERHAERRRASTGDEDVVLAVGEHVGFEHVGAGFLVRSDHFQQILDGDQSAVTLDGIDDGEVEDSVPVHQAHAFVE